MVFLVLSRSKKEDLSASFSHNGVTGQRYAKDFFSVGKKVKKCPLHVYLSSLKIPAKIFKGLVSSNWEKMGKDITME